MDAVEVIERACAEHPELRLRPSPPRDEVEALEAELGVPLPGDLRALLERAGGIDGGPLETIDFTGASFDVEISRHLPVGPADRARRKRQSLGARPHARRSAAARVLRVARPARVLAPEPRPRALPGRGLRRPASFAEVARSRGPPLPRLAREPGRARSCSGARRRRRAARVRGDARRPLSRSSICGRRRSGRASRGDATDRRPRSAATATGGSSPTPHRNRSRRAVCWAGSSGSPTILGELASRSFCHESHNRDLRPRRAFSWRAASDR